MIKLPDHLNEEFEFYLSKIKDDNAGISNKAAIKKTWAIINKRYHKKGDVWEAANSIAGEISKEDFYNLYSADMDSAPDLTEQAKEARKRFESYPEKFFIESAGEIVSEFDNAAMLDKAEGMKNSNPENFVLIKSVLCTSYPYVNANGAAFKPEDLKEAVDEGQLGPGRPAILDWVHDFVPYGTTTKAEIEKVKIPIDMGNGDTEEQEVSQIVVYSVFWAWLFEEKAAAIRQWYKDKKLGFSMACGAKSREWVEEENRYFYFVRKPEFLANSIITPKHNPADKNALPKDMAVDVSGVTQLSAFVKDNQYKRNTGDDFDMNELEKAKARITELESKLSDAMAKIADFEAKIKGNAVEDLQTQLDEANSKFEALQAEYDELSAKVHDSEEELVSLKAELEGSKEKYDKVVAQLVESRKDEAKRINDERREEIASIGNLTDENVDYWASKWTVEVSEDGSLETKADDYAEWFSNMPKAKEDDKPVDEESSDDDADEDEDPKDVDKSAMVKATEESGEVVTKENQENKKRLFSRTVAE